MTITTRLKTTVAALALASIASSAFAAEKSGWSYAGPTGPNKWGELSADYHLCKAGLQQSPIDLAEANARRVNPDLTVFRVSATTGDGLSAWLEWILRGLEFQRSKRLENVDALRRRVAELERQLAQK